jgi:esterase/lipase
MGDTLASVENLYLSLQSKVNDAVALCQTQEEKNAVMQPYLDARQNYWDCVNKTFQENDPELEAFVAEAKTVAAEVNQINVQRDKIAKYLDLANKAVSIGTEILAKAIKV